MWYDQPLSQRNRIPPFCQLCKETLKISHPLIIKPTTPFLASHPFLVKISHLPITAIFEKSHPHPLYEGRDYVDLITLVLLMSK